MPPSRQALWKIFITLWLSAAIGAFCLAPAAQASDTGWHEVDRKLRIAALESTKFEVLDSEVKFEAGELLLDSISATTVKMPLATVQARGKSLVYARARSGCEHVFVLLGTAIITVGRHKTSLSSGEEAVVTDHVPGHKDLVGEDEVGRRRVRIMALPEDRHFALSEFSLIQAVEREPLVYRLLQSTDPHDKALRERLIKMAAVLNIVTGRHGQYTTRLP